MFLRAQTSETRVVIKTESPDEFTCNSTILLTGRFLRLAQTGSVLGEGGKAQSFGGGVYCKRYMGGEELQNVLKFVFF